MRAMSAIDITCTRRSMSSSSPSSPTDPLPACSTATAMHRQSPGSTQVHLFASILDDFKQVNDNWATAPATSCAGGPRPAAARPGCGRAEDRVLGVATNLQLLLPWLSEDPCTSHLARQCVDTTATPFGAAQRGGGRGHEHGNSGHPGLRMTSATLARADQAMYRVKRSGKRGFYIARPKRPAAAGSGSGQRTGPLPQARRLTPTCLAACCQRLKHAPCRPQSSNQLLSNTRRMRRFGVPGHVRRRGSGSAALAAGSSGSGRAWAGSGR